MTTKIKAQVLEPALGYRLFYRDPIFDLEELDSDITKAVFAAFRPWNIALENVTVKENAANLSEEATSFSLLRGKITFSITPGGCVMHVANPNWTERDLILHVGNAGIAAALAASEAIVDKQVATLIMHLSPSAGSRSLTDTTSKFLNLDLPALIGTQPKSCGFSIYRDDLLWVVDRSVSYEDSLFVRMDRWFKTESLAEIASQLDSDERTLLDALGVEVE